MDAAALISGLANDRWRALLEPLLDSNQSVRNAAYKDLEGALREPQRRESDLWPNGADALRLIAIGMTVQFPPTVLSYKSPAHDILFWFVTVKWPPLVGAIAEHFAAADDAARLDAMTILAAQRTDDALRLLGALIEQHGMPQKMYQRFFWELNDSFEFADRLMPQLILQAGRYLPNVVDFVNIAHERGKLTPAKLVPAIPLVEREAAELLRQVQRRQVDRDGTQWRFEHDYVSLSHSLGAHLDLLALIPGASIEPLHEAVTLADPRLLSIVAAGLLKRGVEPPPEIVRRAAASSVVRAHLYRILEALGRLDLFPAELASFEAFAAAHMASWLAYPSELGYEPEYLELEATLRGKPDDGERQWCLWKFKDADGAAYAAVSGPYELTPSAGPLSGDDTFSNFAEWDSATPEQHLESVLATLRDWRIARCARDG